MSTIKNQEYSLGLFLKFFLFYTLIVILWGAWVRISHSGNGCGETWPLCQGELIPTVSSQKTWTEYAHRLMSGFYGLVTIFIFYKLRTHHRKDLANASFWTMFFMISEALLGAKLVLFGLTGSNDSYYRSFVMALHLLNSFFLVFWTFKMIWINQAQEKKLAISEPKMLRAQYIPFVILVIAMLGTIAALANTLLPASSLLEGIVNDFSTNSHWLVRARVFHPIFAIGSGAVLYYLIYPVLSSEPHWLQKKVRKWAFIFIIGLTFGAITLFSLSPTWMKLTHLLIAYFIWILSLDIRFAILFSQKQETK